MALLERLGCPVKVERGDRVFPVSEKASDVTRALEKELRRLGVSIRLNTKVSRILVENEAVCGAELEDGTRLDANRGGQPPRYRAIPRFRPGARQVGEIQPRHAGHPGHPRRSQGGGGDRLIRHMAFSNRGQTGVRPRLAPFAGQEHLLRRETAFRPRFPLRQQKSRLQQRRDFCSVQQ